MPSFPDTILATRSGLTLTALNSSDAPALVRAFRDAELRRWLPLPSPYTTELAETWCTRTAPQLRESGSGLVLGIRRDGELVGSVDVKRVDWRSHTLELSYWVAAGHRGRGIMTSALRCVADWLITDLGFERIELRIAPGNTGSQAVARSAGFTCEGTARNAGFTDAGRTDLVIWSCIPADGDIPG